MQFTVNSVPYEVMVYGEAVFKIKMGEGHPSQSEAILPQQEWKSNCAETEDSISVSTRVVSLQINKADGTVRFYKADNRENGTKETEVKDGSRVLISETYPGETYAATENGGFVLNFKVTEKEHIYGLGEDNDVDFGRLDRRGTVRNMITGQRINRNRLTADFPIPFLLSAGGAAPYGYYIDNTYNLTVDVAKTVEDKVSVLAPGGACEFWFIGGEDATKVVQNFSALTGRAKLPPLWVLGYMQSKCTFWDWEEIDDAIAAFVDNGVPIDSIVFDFDWAQYFNNYQWNDRWEGKSPEKMKYYSETYGIRFMASNSGPMLKKDSDTFDSAVEAGILARDTEGNTVTCGHYSGELMDFTNPETEKWLEPQLKKVMEEGISSWWLDLTEPEGEAENTVYHIGSKQEIHNIFSNHTSNAYHNIMKRAYPGKRSFVLTRTGTAGIQRNPTALWTGDIFSDYGTLKTHVPEALNTCLSGISMWTCDTSGFLSTSNNAECPYNLYHNDRAEHGALYERWAQFSCFTPMFRAHHAGGEVVPHRFQETTFDGISRYIKLRYRLIPYIYSLYYENYLHGTPIMRPLFWHYPKEEKAYTIQDEYLFGEQLLVAPVLDPQVAKRTVYLPEGTWYDLDYGYEYKGGEREVYAPQNRIPVFVKAGAVLPMTKLVQNTRELDWSRLELLIYPEGDSEGSIFADDGETDNYQKGEYTETKVRCVETKNAIKVTLSAENTLFPVKQVTLHIRMKKAPINLLLNGKEVRKVNRMNTVTKSEDDVFYFDEFNRMLHAKLDISAGAEIEIPLDENRTYEPMTSYEEKQLSGQLPFIYPPATVPCKLEAIHYDRGGEGVAYHKRTEDNGSEFRPDNAGVIKTEKGYAVRLTAGEWIEYTLSSNGGFGYHLVLVGDVAGAKLTASAGGAEGEVVNGTAVLHVENGEPVLCLKVTEGEVLLEQIRIEAIA